jgi:hypothetical protein
VQYLTQPWLDECRRQWAGQPERVGASARIQYVVRDAPGSEAAVRYYQVFVDGRIAQSALGTLPDPEVSLTLSYADSVAIVRGELDPDAAFARGDIGFEGEMRTLMGMFPILWPSPVSRARTPRRYLALQADIRAVTDIPSG